MGCMTYFLWHQVDNRGFIEQFGETAAFKKALRNGKWLRASIDVHIDFCSKFGCLQKIEGLQKIMHVKQQQLSQRHCTTWMNWTESYWKTWNSSQKPSAWNEVPLGVVKLATLICLLCFWSTNPFTTCKGKIIIFHVWSIYPPLLEFLWTVFPDVNYTYLMPYGTCSL